MRDIKFRCWFAEKMWYAIPAIRFDKDGVRVVDLNQKDDDFSLSPDTWTGNDDYVLMQFTGLKDHKGNNIYEGDILADRKSTWVVSWNDNHACFMVTNHEHPSVVAEVIDNQNMTIVGNIYEQQLSTNTK